MMKAIVKFNGGRGAILCSKCRVIIKEGHEFNDEEKQYIKGEIEFLPEQYCEQCVIKDTNSKEKV